MGAPSDATLVSRRFRILVPLRHRDFRFLWSGMTVSLLGDGITTIALAWQAYELSNAPTALAVIGVAQTIPHVLLLLVGGAVSDRFERRKVLIAADTVRMLAVCALGVLAVTGHIQIWHMMVIAACYGAGSAFFGPTFDAVVPDLVPEGELAQANSLDQFVRPAVFRMLGPACGGWIIAMFGGRAGPAFFVDAATFVVSVACLLMVSRRPAPGAAEDEDGDRVTITQEIAEGLRYVRTRVWLWGTFLAATLAYLIFWGPAEVLVPYVVKVEMGRGAGVLGLVFAFGGIGAMFAAIVMSNRALPRRFMTFMYISWTVSTLMVTCYGLARLPWQLMAASFVFNALESRGPHRVDHHEAAPHPRPAARTRLQPRLVHLDRAGAAVLRARRTDRGCVRRPGNARRRRADRWCDHLRLPVPARDARHRATRAAGRGAARPGAGGVK